MKLEKILSQLKSGVNKGLLTMAFLTPALALPTYTAEARPIISYVLHQQKVAEQKAQQTYDSFSEEERKKFDKYFDVDFSKLEDFEVSFLQDSYQELFQKGTFDIRKMTLQQKLKIFDYSQETVEEEARQSYNSFSLEERKKFDKYFDGDISKMPDDLAKAFNKKYQLFPNEFDIRDMTFSQKMRVWECNKEEEQDRLRNSEGFNGFYMPFSEEELKRIDSKGTFLEKMKARRYRH